MFILVANVAFRSSKSYFVCAEKHKSSTEATNAASVLLYHCHLSRLVFSDSCLIHLCLDKASSLTPPDLPKALHN